MSLPDPLLSRAVLIGSYSYIDLDPLPSVANNLARLSGLFRSADLWGLPSQNCRVLPNPSGPAEVLDVIHQAALEASDTLLVYYAGHGLLDPHTDDLYLALPDSDPGRLYSSVRFDDLRRELVTVANASSKVVILDCCYSGRAMVGGMSGSMEMADQARIEGTYLMTASAETVKAQAPVGEEFTAFTNELVSALESGLPDGPDLLNVETLYWHIRKELIAKIRPIPQQRAGNDGGMIVLARNRRGVRLSSESRHPGRLLPEPPEDLGAFLRRSPRELATEITRLTNVDLGAQARQLLIAAAARRPDQEVAALIAVLREQHRRSEVELVIDAVTLRPAEQIASLIAVLREIGSGHDADQVLDAVARGTLEDIGSVADVLAKKGKDSDLRRMLDMSIMAHRHPEEVIALVGTLLSIGLEDEISRLLDLAAADLTDAETGALADALRGAGRDDAAFRLYLAAPGSIARRPVEDVASLLRAMRDADRDDYADKLLSYVSAATNQPQEVIEMTSALWSVSLDGDSASLLEAATASLSDQQIATVAQLLRDRDRHEAALQLCVKAAALHPVPAAITIVQALRDAGRPVDANHLLDSSQAWPPEKFAELIALLRAEGSHTDADREVTASQGIGGHRLAEIMAALKHENCNDDVDRLAALVTVGTSSEACDLVSALLAKQLQAEAEAFLIKAAATSGEYYIDLTNVLRERQLLTCVNYIERWAIESESATFIAHLASLRERNLHRDADELLNGVSTRPIVEIVTLISGLSHSSIKDAKALLALLRQRSAQDLVSVLAELQVSLLDEVPGFLAAICEDQTRACSLVSELRRTRADETANTLLQGIARHVTAAKLFAFRKALARDAQVDDADSLLAAAIAVRPVSFMSELINSAGSLDSLWYGPQRAQRTQAALASIAAQRASEDIDSFIRALKRLGLRSEMKQLRNLSR